MTSRVFLGMLTPSSNTVLEPVTTAMLSGLPEVTAHFSRFKVTEIALSGPALAQFDDSEILRAAELLAHAKVNVIAWNGTSSGWLGFERDWQLCERITQATGIPACTAMLALNEILEKTGAKRIGFVTPYLDDVQARINANYEKDGLHVVADRHLRMQDNFSFSTVTEDQIRAMTKEAAAASPTRSRSCAPTCAARRSPRSLRRSTASRSTTRSPPRCGSFRRSQASIRRVSKAWGRLFSALRRRCDPSRRVAAGIERKIPPYGAPRRAIPHGPIPFRRLSSKSLRSRRRVQFGVRHEGGGLARGRRRMDDVVAGDHTGRRLDRAQIGFCRADDQQARMTEGNARAKTSSP